MLRKTKGGDDKIGHCILGHCYFGSVSKQGESDYLNARVNQWLVMMEGSSEATHSNT